MITIYIGKSGAGKDYFCKKRVKAGSKPVVTYTTRPIRDKEVDGVDYHFVTKEEFLDMIKNNSLIEHRSYNTLFNGKPDIWYYGSPMIDPSDDYSCVVDLTGAMSYVKAYGSENVDVVYVSVNDDIRKSRAMMRGTFSEEEWNRRLEDDNDKFSIEKLEELSKMLNKPITIIDNNGDKPMFATLEYRR
ncbi:MAG: guanylate kinase Gmk3 [Lachnospiraceae bacterium]|nr:guanylate kinase Gmk3 [Lachnospiraceae bacterium]